MLKRKIDPKMAEEIAKDIESIDAKPEVAPAPKPVPKTEPEHFGPCPDCNGTGLQDSQTHCPTCAGSGKSLPPTEG